MKKIKIKRIYDKPEKGDGARVLVDRLWPRGISKRRAKIDYWAKELAPSSQLRAWFHKDRDGRWIEFQKRYRNELKQNRKGLSALHIEKRKTFTFVTASKDLNRSHAAVFKRFVSRYRDVR